MYKLEVDENELSLLKSSIMANINRVREYAATNLAINNFDEADHMFDVEDQLYELLDKLNNVAIKEN